MGLLNMGPGEGSQIIQLFGRGVRPRMGRTSHCLPPQDRPKASGQTGGAKHLLACANYMAAFKDYLRRTPV